MVTDDQVLTEDEHEALMAGMSGGLEDDLGGPLPGMPGPDAAAGEGSGLPVGREKVVKAYDFRRPEKFSRDQLRALRGVHEQLMRLLNSTLAGYLRTTVEFRLEPGGVEQSSYREFTASSTEGNLIYVISLDPLPAPILLEVSAELVFSSLDRLLGGTGKRLRHEREPTELERALFLENWLLPVLDNLRAAWQTIAAVSPSVGPVETNASFVQIALPSDAVVSVTLGAVIGDGEGVLRLCYTYATLEPIIQQLDSRQLIQTGAARHRLDDGQNVRRGLNAILLPMVAQLGAAEVTLEELLELQRGDVIRLDTLVEQEITILVNGERKYLGRPGLRKQRLAVRISSIVEEEDGFGGSVN